MIILFDKTTGSPYEPQSITDDINDFGRSYSKTVKAVIDRTRKDLTRDIFIVNVAQLMANFKMTRRGPFHGVKYTRGHIQDPNRKVSACWSAIGSSVVGLRNILLQHSNVVRSRLIVDIPDSLKRKVVSDLKQMFNLLLPECMGEITNGRVAASKILFAVLPELALPVDTAMWKKLFKTTDYGNIIALMVAEIMAWESQTGEKLDTCDTSGNSTLPAIYNVMAMKART